MKTLEQKRAAVRECMRRWRETHREEDRRRSSEWQKLHPAKAKARRDKWNANNPAKNAASKTAYAKRNIERERERKKAYKVARPGIVLAEVRKRQAAKLLRTPEWANMKEIENIYIESAKRRGQGEDVHVDHIFPLRGKLVSGLHVENNLRIIPAIANMRKANRFAQDS